MHIRLHNRFAVACLLASALVMAGCSSGGNGSEQASTPAAAPAETTSDTAATGTESDFEGGTIKIAYVEWASCLAATNVVKATLEKAGYDVQTVSVTAAMLYEGLANGDVDGMVCAWLPTTHEAYYAKTRDKLVNLGPNMKGTRIGLVVPDYVKIDSIPQLADIKDKLEGRIIGIDPGAGIMSATEKAVEAYKLPLKLVVGSGATMTAALGNAIRLKKPVVVTGWTPHWMWARWDLKYLDDPKGVYGEPENIETLVRKGLKQDMPRAYAVLDAFAWTGDDMGQVMAADREEGSDPMTNAREWLDAHPDVVARWLPDH